MKDCSVLSCLSSSQSQSNDMVPVMMSMMSPLRRLRRESRVVRALHCRCQPHGRGAADPWVVVSETSGNQWQYISTKYICPAGPPAHPPSPLKHMHHIVHLPASALCSFCTMQNTSASFFCSWAVGVVCDPVTVSVSLSLSLSLRLSLSLSLSLCVSVYSWGLCKACVV